MIREEKWSIWRKSLFAIILSFIIIYIIESVGSRSVIPNVFPPNTKNILESGFENAEVIENSIEEIFDPIYNNLGERSLLIDIITGTLTALVSGGLFAAIYKKIAYNKEINIRDIFSLFENNLVRNLLASFIFNVLVKVGMLLLIVPGIVAYLGLYPWVLLASESENDNKSGMDLIKMTWEVTSGKKSMIFNKTIKWGFLYMFAQVIPILLFIFSTLFMGNRDGSLNVVFLTIAVLLLIIFTLAARTLLVMKDIEVGIDLVDSSRLPYSKFKNWESKQNDESDYLEIEFKDEDRL